MGWGWGGGLARQAALARLSRSGARVCPRPCPRAPALALRLAVPLWPRHPPLPPRVKAGDVSAGTHHRTPPHPPRLSASLRSAASYSLEVHRGRGRGTSRAVWYWHATLPHDTAAQHRHAALSRRTVAPHRRAAPSRRAAGLRSDSRRRRRRGLIVAAAGDMTRRRHDMKQKVMAPAALHQRPAHQRRSV